ncbi:alpha/beta fold hydrolase [Streptosporangium lutulentum]
MVSTGIRWTAWTCTRDRRARDFRSSSSTPSPVIGHVAGPARGPGDHLQGHHPRPARLRRLGAGRGRALPRRDGRRRRAPDGPRGNRAGVVGGLSMGGYVTMALCRRHPDRVLGVILADTKAGADPEAARSNRERIAATVLDSGTSVLLEEVLPGLLGQTTVRRRAMVFGRVRGLVQAAPPGAVAWAQRAMAGRLDSFDTLRALKVPVLVIVGEEDETSPLADAEAMTRAVPDGRLAVIEKAGHLSAVEQPEAFNRAVAGFIDELAGGSPPRG